MTIKALEFVFFIIATVCMIFSVIFNEIPFVSYWFHTASAFFWGVLITRMLTIE